MVNIVYTDWFRFSFFFSFGVFCVFVRRVVLHHHIRRTPPALFICRWFRIPSLFECSIWYPSPYLAVLKYRGYRAREGPGSLSLSHSLVLGGSDHLGSMARARVCRVCWCMFQPIHLLPHTTYTFAWPFRLGCTTQNVVVSGTAGQQSTRMGMFEVQPTLTSGGKAVYKNSNGEYLYYWPEYSYWRIGSDYKKADAGVTSNSKTDTTCPQDSSSWEEYVDGSWKASSITVVAGACACRLATLLHSIHTRPVWQWMSISFILIFMVAF